MLKHIANKDSFSFDAKYIAKALIIKTVSCNGRQTVHANDGVYSLAGYRKGNKSTKGTLPKEGYVIIDQNNKRRPCKKYIMK